MLVLGLLLIGACQLSFWNRANAEIEHKKWVEEEIKRRHAQRDLRKILAKEAKQRREVRTNARSKAIAKELQDQSGSLTESNSLLSMSSTIRTRNP